VPSCPRGLEVLKRIKIKNFKSLAEVSLDLPPLAVIFGPNATGKSNFLDALQLLSRLATARTVAEALDESVIRGYPAEQFSLPSGGLSKLLKQDQASFSLEADLQTRRQKQIHNLRYRIGIKIQPATGALGVSEEYLRRLTKDFQEIKAWPPRIETEGREGVIRRVGKASRPEKYNTHEVNYTVLSERRLTGTYYADFDQARAELGSWQIYYLEPRQAMRGSAPPREVTDIGAQGHNLASFLYRLKHDEDRKPAFNAVVRSLRTIIPSIEGIDVELNEKLGYLDVQLIEEGTSFSLRLVSEGTLRVLALCAIAFNPWAGSLVAFEEPENGVHPKRLEHIVNLLIYMSQYRQVVVTTHSPPLVSAMLELARNKPNRIGLFVCRRRHGSTVLEEFEPTGPIFEQSEIGKGLEDPRELERIVFARALLEGWIDG